MTEVYTYTLQSGAIFTVEAYATFGDLMTTAAMLGVMGIMGLSMAFRVVFKR